MSASPMLPPVQTSNIASTGQGSTGQDTYIRSRQKKEIKFLDSAEFVIS